MTTLQEAAMRKALELGKRYAKCLMMNQAPFDEALESLRTALAKQGEQQPVCAGCGMPEGDVHMSTCQSGKWPLRVSNGDTATPAPQPLTDKEQIALNKRELFAQMEAPVAWMNLKAKVPMFRSKKPSEDEGTIVEHWQPLYTAEPAPQPKGLFIDMITEHGPEFVAEIAAIGETAPQPAQDATTGCACRWDTNDNRVATCERHQGWLDVVSEWADRAKAAESALQSVPQVASVPLTDKKLKQQGEQQPVAWTHSCNALCTDGLELWCDHCPHCGKPRTTHAEQWPPGLITDIVLTVTALHKEVDIGWSPDARGCAYCNHPLFLGSKCKNCGKEVK